MKRLNGFNYNYEKGQISEILLFSGARTVRNLRKIACVSQGEAALRSDISQSYLSNVENAKHMLSTEKLVHLTCTMGLHPKTCFDLLVLEMFYSESIYRRFNENMGKYSEYENFQEFVKNNLKNFNS